MRVEDGVAYPEGALTLAETPGLLAAGAAAFTMGARVFDLAGVGQVDSSALSLLFAWQRRARATNIPLNFRNLPESLHSLAKLYGVGEIITL